MGRKAGEKDCERPEKMRRELFCRGPIRGNVGPQLNTPAALVTRMAAWLAVPVPLPVLEPSVHSVPVPPPAPPTPAPPALLNPTNVTD